MIRLTMLAMPLALLATTAAPAQLSGLADAGKSKLGGLLSGLGGTLGDGVPPNLNAISVGNATGVLGYCVKNNLLRERQNLAGGLLGKLVGRPAVQSSPGFIAGQQGLVQGGGRKLSLDALPERLKAKACDLVLSKVQTFM